jgi:hypothetical protein
MHILVCAEIQGGALSVRGFVKKSMSSPGLTDFEKVCVPDSDSMKQSTFSASTIESKKEC